MLDVAVDRCAGEVHVDPDTPVVDVLIVNVVGPLGVGDGVVAQAVLYLHLHVHIASVICLELPPCFRVLDRQGTVAAGI